MTQEGFKPTSMCELYLDNIHISNIDILLFNLRLDGGFEPYRFLGWNPNQTAIVKGTTQIIDIHTHTHTLYQIYWVTESI